MNHHAGRSRVGRRLDAAGPTPSDLHSPGIARLEQVRAGVRAHVGALVQRRQVVEDPDRTSLGRDDQVVAVHAHVGNRRDREVELHGLPLPAAVERDVQAVLRSRVHNPVLDRILTHRAHRTAGPNTVHDQRPRAAIIVGAEDVGPEVVEPEPLHADIRTPWPMRREVDVLHSAVGRHPGRGDVLP